MQTPTVRLRPQALLRVSQHNGHGLRPDPLLRWVEVLQGLPDRWDPRSHPHRIINQALLDNHFLTMCVILRWNDILYG